VDALQHQKIAGGGEDAVLAGVRAQAFDGVRADGHAPGRVDLDGVVRHPPPS
jgi:hypothetical protein